MENLSGKRLKGYQIYERIGAGSIGVVYGALHLTVGRDVAVKVIPPHVASQPEFIRHFAIEAQRISRLEHIHIVPLYDFWRDPTGAYLVMRRIRPGSLSQALQRGPLDLSTVSRMLDQVASGLTAAHTQQIVHRGVKPSNILLDEEGNAYLCDFGFTNDACQPGNPTQLQDAHLASLDYLSPEQLRGGEITPQTDQYGLGITLYEALTGLHPDPGIREAEHLYGHSNEPLPPITILDPATSDAIIAVIQKATHKDPGRRYSDMHTMAAAFRSAAGIAENGAGASLIDTLTRREQEILAHIVEGHSNKQIASALFVELGTVKWHITQLYRKMGIRSRMQAIHKAQEFKLISTARDIDQGQNYSPGSLISEPSRLINPYKGLLPFKSADNRDFFGREALIDRILDRLRETGEMARFLAVLGPSGSGKSSLLNAGLVPAIWSGKLAGSEGWFVVEMTPGARPVDELEVALTRIASRQADRLHASLNHDPEGLLRAGSQILADDGSEIVLLIDQFEELFILTEDKACRDHFLELICRAVTHPKSRVRVVIALRADFYDMPLYHASFGALLRSRMETLLPLSAEELERAIVQPARQVSVQFEPGLPTRIIAEMLSQPGALPLLQYALTELFESREDRLMTQSAYEALGGAVGALALRADEVYQGFGEAARQATRQMFLRLVNLGEGMGDGAHLTETRRRISRDELLALVEDPELMEEVIDTFTAFRMLSRGHDALSRQPTVELAHEALIFEWHRLRAWLAESREDLLQYRRFQTLAEEWQKNSRDSGFLLRVARLDQFASWAEGTSLTLTPDEQVFLEASIQARQARRQVEEQRRRRELETAHKLAETENLRAEQQAQANRNLRRLAVGLALFLFVAIGAALFAWQESRRAKEQAQIAFSRELASAAVGTLTRDPELSIYLAIQAVQATHERDGFVLPVAEEALHHAIQNSRVAITFPQSGGVAFSPDSKYLVIGGTDGSIGIWDAQAGERLNTLAGHTEPVTSIAFSLDGKLLASASEDHLRIVWEFSTGRPVLVLPGFNDPALPRGLSKVVFSPDGKYLLSTAQFEEAAIWDLVTGEQIIHFDDSAGPTAAFSPDGHKLALMTAVWDVSAILGVPGMADREKQAPVIVSWQERLFDYADPLIEFRAPSSEIENAYLEPGSVSFSPDGDRLLTTVISSLGVMRDADSGEPLFTLSGHTNIINGTVFSSNGMLVATAGSDGTARVWDAASGQALKILEGHQDEVVQVAFSPDSQRLATSSLDGTTKIWDITSDGGGEWLEPREHAGKVLLAFDPYAPHLVTIGEDGLVENLDLQTGNILFIQEGLQETFTVPAFSPDGSVLALGDRMGAVQLFEASNGDWLRTLQLGRVASALAFSPQGELLFTGSEDGVLSVVDMNNGEILVEWVVQDGYVNGLVFGPDNKSLYIAGAEGDIIAADINYLLPELPGVESFRSMGKLPERAIIKTITGHEDVIIQFELNPAGTKLLTASWDGTARVWDATTGKSLAKLTGHKGRVWRAAFYPNRQRIATAGADGSVIVWDADLGEQLFVLDSFPVEVSDLAFSPDGKFLAASGNDGSVRVYLMPVDDLMTLGRERISRDLTAEECQRYLHLDQCPGKED